MVAKLFVIAGYDSGSNPTNLVQCYDVVSNSWSYKASMPVKRAEGASVIYQGKIYCIGGFDDTNTETKTNYVYDIETDSWTLKAPMPNADYRMEAVVNDGIIYVIGGQINYQAIYSYNPVTDTWATLTSIPIGLLPFAGYLSDMTVQVYNGKIYCLGGGVNYGVLHHIVAYDIVSDTWSQIEALDDNMGGFGLASVLLNDVIYFMGWWNAVNNKNQKYNITTNTVTNLTDIPNLAAYSAIGLVGNDIIYASGQDGSYALLLDTFIYHIPTDTWEAKANILSGTSLAFYGLFIPAFLDAKYYFEMNNRVTL